jgi:hypothetical protein
VFIVEKPNQYPREVIPTDGGALAPDGGAARLSANCVTGLSIEERQSDEQAERRMGQAHEFEEVALLH